jgi:hypothetical protein
MKTDLTEFNIKNIKIRLPYQLRSHHDFKNVKITVDQDQIHFQLTNRKTNLPELWMYDHERKSWASIDFLADETNIQI